MKRPIRVLIVDDREAARLTLRNILLGFECIFSEAQYGGTALQLISETEFDVIFLDLGLPDLSGIQVLREARRLGTVTGKVIILTGLPEPTTEAEANALGVFKYLRKPLDWEEIRSTFAEAISDSAPSFLEQKPEPQTERTTNSTSGAHTRAMVIANASRDSRPRLLILDDNRPWLDTMQQVLGNDFDLTMTTSADEAYKWVRKGHFALVVLDMRLVGGVSGLDVLSKMRKATPDLRAIMLTEHPDLGSAVESGRRGALDYVSKKDVATLRDIVKRILSDNATPVRIFLSYERTDKEKVANLYDKLMRRGFLPWMDIKSIVAGKWEPQIRKAIDRSNYFIFCLSRNSLYKEGVMRKEVRQALERQSGLQDDSVFFIPVRIEDCEVVEPFNEFQYIDLFRRDGFTKLTQALSYKNKTNEGVSL